jgi:Flp pilus assembly pilin Flp
MNSSAFRSLRSRESVAGTNQKPQNTIPHMPRTTRNKNELSRPSRFREGGQGMVEYAFILVLISLVVVVMLMTTGSQIRNMYSDITYTLHNQAGL